MKIVNVKILKKKIKFFKKKKIGLCHGVFDILHYGHIKHFEEAKTYCDILVVSLTTDKYVGKGNGRPYFSEEIRANTLASLSVIDYVVISKYPTAVEIINNIKPNYYFKDKEYKNFKDDITGNINKEVKILKKHKGKIIFTKQKNFSSSNIINNFSNYFNEKQRIFINNLKKKYSYNDLKNLIDNFYKLKVLVIGEIIIDEYTYVDTIGKSGKEPHLVMSIDNFKKYLGGAGAITNHINSFVKQLNFLSITSSNSIEKKFINNNLNKSINKKFMEIKNYSIIKNRYIDKINNVKLFGVYSIKNSEINIVKEKEIISKLKKLINHTDLILVADYDHGLITNDILKILSDSKKFLVINSQLNSTNIGYHTLQKYKSSDVIVINESELRHELRSRTENLKNLILKYSKKTNIRFIIITQGSVGSTLYDNKNKKFTDCPAFANKVVDKIGAGDTFLSILSLALASRINPELSLFFSTIAASINLSFPGNEINVKKNELLKIINHIFK